MANAHALHSAPVETAWPERLEQAAFLALVGVAGALQFSIAVAQSLLTIAVVCWLALVIVRRERVEVPPFFWLLLAYAALTLVSVAFSPDPRASLLASKQLVLLLIVPITFRLFPGRRGAQLLTVVVTFGAASAAFGIFQYAILQYDHLGMRPRGTLGHWMTYSGLLMMVISLALARTVFGTRDRLWAALVMPALAVAIALTFTRSAAVGACAAAAFVLALKDRRLVAVLPVVAALFFALAPTAVTKRFISTFDLRDPTSRDRVAMMREGEHMIRAHPLVGVGPNMVKVVYSQYRDPEAVEAVNPHLHNVPIQIAAERGLPALAVWLAFIALLVRDLWRMFKHGLERQRFLAVAALAAIISMLAAGMFEYNFGDSEFLMLLLIVITLPFAAARAGALDA